MKTVTVTFEISVDHLLKTLKEAGLEYDLILKDNIDLIELQKELNNDIENDIAIRLDDFIAEGLEQECYLDFFDEQ